MMSVDVNEQVRRRELMRDMRAASQQGQELEEYRAKRDRTVEEWTAWLHAAMDRAGATDPVEVLPQALAQVQERAIAEARAAAKATVQHEIRRMFRKALG